jgi:hypothetical protein
VFVLTVVGFFDAESSQVSGVTTDNGNSDRHAVVTKGVDGGLFLVMR